jgi:ornithine cyclodeaminase/alanine dehydrogenase-like protein (mu-crystallin family)
MCDRSARSAHGVRRARNLEKFAAETTARVMDSAEAAVRGADVIVLATASSTPAIDNLWVDDGAHVISVGACRPTQREMDPALGDPLTIVRRLTRGSRKGIGRRNRRRRSARRWGVGESSGSYANHSMKSRCSKSLGLAVEDVVAAHLALQRARQRGIGKEI